MATTPRQTISRDDIYRTVADQFRESLRRGGGLWYYVRVWPDGEITAGVEVSPCYPESEYFGRKPHAVTIWSTRSNSDLSDAEIDAEMDALDQDWLDLNVGDGDLAAAIRPTGLELEG